VADLFAGSGALGLEALSRGAAHALFAEQDPAAIRAIRANIANLRAQGETEVRVGSVMALGPTKAPYDIILMDPPYGTGAGIVALDKLNWLGWVHDATWIVLETAAKEPGTVRGFDVMAERVVGKARLTFLKKTVVAE
jgi:16S rRNA (guanine966-N2)-methyltransferase